VTHELPPGDTSDEDRQVDLLHVGFLGVGIWNVCTYYGVIGYRGGKKPMLVR